MHSWPKSVVSARPAELAGQVHLDYQAKAQLHELPKNSRLGLGCLCTHRGDDGALFRLGAGDSARPDVCCGPERAEANQPPSISTPHSPRLHGHSILRRFGTALHVPETVTIYPSQHASYLLLNTTDESRARSRIQTHESTMDSRFARLRLNSYLDSASHGSENSKQNSICHWDAFVGL